MVISGMDGARNFRKARFLFYVKSNFLQAELHNGKLQIQVSVQKGKKAGSILLLSRTQYIVAAGDHFGVSRIATFPLLPFFIGYFK
jgi:hypothetical protein